MSNTKIEIYCGAEALFRSGAPGNVLLPTSNDERAAVFKALTDALAILADIDPRPSAVSTEAANSGHYSGSEQYPADHKACDVLSLSERLALQNEGNPTE